MSNKLLVILWLVLLSLFGMGAVRASWIGSPKAATAFSLVLLILLTPVLYMLKDRFVNSIRMLVNLIVDYRRRARQRAADYEAQERLRQWRIENDARNKEIKYLQSYAAPHLMLGLHPLEFEQFVLRYFRLIGFDARETKATGDGGIDGYLLREGQVFLLQCKRWAGNTVGEPLLRELLGAVTKEGARGAFFVTTATFSTAAVEWAKNTPIMLLDGESFAQRLQALSITDPIQRSDDLPIARPHFPV